MLQRQLAEIRCQQRFRQIPNARSEDFLRGASTHFEEPILTGVELLGLACCDARDIAFAEAGLVPWVKDGRLLRRFAMDVQFLSDYLVIKQS